MVEVTDTNDGTIYKYHIDKALQHFLIKKVKDRITKKDRDYVLLIDGYEGSGKSTLAQQIAKFVDPSLSLDRICMTADEFKEAIIKAQKGQSVIYDEAVTGLTAGDTIGRVGRLLKSLMMQMRQKNLFVIVILPSVFEFNNYAVLSRAISLFHTYESHGRIGFWIGFNRKSLRLLYLKGKKTHSYKIHSPFRGKFFGKYTVDEEKYREKKMKALDKIDYDGETEDSRHLLQGSWAFWKLKCNKIGYNEMSEDLKKHKIILTPEALRLRVTNFIKKEKKAGRIVEDE
jgi:energy-coupling factor transporter ATP-binding protein EcfA2